MPRPGRFRAGPRRLMPLVAMNDYQRHEPRRFRLPARTTALRRQPKTSTRSANDGSSLHRQPPRHAGGHVVARARHPLLAGAEHDAHEDRHLPVAEAPQRRQRAGRGVAAARAFEPGGQGAPAVEVVHIARPQHDMPGARAGGAARQGPALVHGGGHHGDLERRRGPVARADLDDPLPARAGERLRRDAAVRQRSSSSWEAPGDQRTSSAPLAARERMNSRSESRFR